MGTAKRERQKANRQQKLEELHKEERTRKTKRRVLQIGLLVAVVFLAVFGGVWLLGGDDDSTSDAPTTTSAIATSVSAETTVPEPTTTGVPETTIPPTPCPAPDGSSPRTTEFPAPPPLCIDVTKVYEAEVVTNKGTFTIELDPGIAPLTVNNFVYLAGYHYFDDTPCHRVAPDFVVQCGDPTGTGGGGPGYTIEDELPEAGAYQLGSVVMANRGPDTNGSQFFIVTGERGTKLPPNYSLFGQVTEGFDTTVAAIAATATASEVPSEPITIVSVTITVKDGAVATPTTIATTSTVSPSTVPGETTTTSSS